MAENYDGNPLIQAIDAKRKAAAEAAASVPKVVSMATRQAYVAPPKRRRGKSEPKIDENSVRVLEEQLARYRSGELTGMVLVSRDRATGGFDVRIIAEPDVPEEVGAVAFYGALGLAQSALIDVALYGADAVTEADEDDIS